MYEEKDPWQIRFERERKARKESESLLEKKSLELWNINQNLEKKIVERTRSLEEALIKAEKADRTKSDFLANISHEIRTPLNAIMGFSSFLGRSNELGEKNKNYVSIIQSSASSLLEIINDILDFSKIESGNFEISFDDFDIYNLCKNVKEISSSKALEKNLTIVFSYDNAIPKSFFSDDTRIRQVLLNLLSNAIKFTNLNGKIFFRVFLVEKNSEFAKVKFQVEDTGIGIPEDRLEAIFKPFVQLEHIANKQQKGTGLGLSICSNILKLLNSRLEVSSEVDKGTTFGFTLNLQISKQELKIDENNFFESDDILNGKNILLAEDNIGNQELMKLIFGEYEVNFDIACDGQKAFELFTKKPNFYDIVLMDINMPKLNGIQSLFMIREFESENNLKKTPVIALTANAIKGDKERFISLGMDDYLSKPINLNALKEIVSKFSK